VAIVIQQLRMYSWYDIQIHIYIHTYTHTYIHTYKHTNIHTYVHTYRQTDRQTDTGRIQHVNVGSLRLTPSTTVGSDTETSLYVHVVGFSTGWVRD